MVEAASGTGRWCRSERQRRSFELLSGDGRSALLCQQPSAWLGCSAVGELLFLMLSFVLSHSIGGKTLESKQKVRGRDGRILD